MISKEQILSEFKLFLGNTGGIDSWLSPNTSNEVFVRLGKINEEPLSKAQLNQLFLLSHEAGASDGFFNYYWLSTSAHLYDVKSVNGFDEKWVTKSTIQSLSHLRWGLYRLYTDCLMFFGNIRTGYRFLRDKNQKELENFFHSKRYDTDAMKKRGPHLPLDNISKDDRYLISEMACKSYDSSGGEKSDLKQFLLDSWSEHQKHGGGRVRIRDILNGINIKKKYLNKHQQLLFSADDILDEEVTSKKDIETKYSRIAKAFERARDAALKNTRNYLSMVNDLDVYVATSMRTREDFRNMADVCKTIFSDERLSDLQLRYFDPTLSAAEGHEDKGLIECLMVKSAKVLVLSTGPKDSYGKDAEAAMALSLGKPVIFYCDEEVRKAFYHDVHPLSRLIQFDTGVAVGAMVTDNLSHVSELLYRIFGNKMEYELEQSKPNYFRLKERLTESVVRLQTDDKLLRETFWNHYKRSTT